MVPGDDEDEGGGNGGPIIDPNRVARADMAPAIAALVLAIPTATQAELAGISRALRILRAVNGD